MDIFITKETVRSLARHSSSRTASRLVSELRKADVITGRKGAYRVSEEAQSAWEALALMDRGNIPDTVAVSEKERKMKTLTNSRGDVTGAEVFLEKASFRTDFKTGTTGVSLSCRKKD